ncbi:hypothetical protein N9L18_00825 [Candidatus Pacebacteria bacterium]|nr:hypothetical protein [Candidatus Paceibacterota bacterium]
MIKLKNGHSFDHMVASGALAFSGRGWFWERPLVWLGLIKPELFTVVIKTITKEPIKGNLRWWKPWYCVRLIKGGAVNKVGLTNPGIDWWCKSVGPRHDFEKYPLVGSMFGTKEDLVRIAHSFNNFQFKAVEVNVSCPNHGDMSEEDAVIQAVKAVAEVSVHPVIVKISVAQNYLAIAEGLKGVAEAISINSVPWEKAFPEEEITPLQKLENRVGGGGGGVSGRPAQYLNWKAVKELVEQDALPVIGPSVMEFEDLEKLRNLGASAISYGAIHLRTPWKPTQLVLKDTTK